jgi:acyl carrier protein
MTYKKQMAMNKRVTQAIFKAVDEVNRLLPKTGQLDKSKDTVLFGQSGILDSLGFINLIVATERKIKEEFGITIILTGERAILQNNDPFQTIGTLSDYITLLLEEKTGG